MFLEFYPHLEYLKGFNHGNSICCFRKITGSSEDTRIGQLKIGGRMNKSEIRVGGGGGNPGKKE